MNSNLQLELINYQKFDQHSREIKLKNYLKQTKMNNND